MRLSSALIALALYYTQTTARSPQPATSFCSMFYIVLGVVSIAYQPCDMVLGFLLVLGVMCLGVCFVFGLGFGLDCIVVCFYFAFIKLSAAFMIVESVSFLMSDMRKKVVVLNSRSIFIIFFVSYSAHIAFFSRPICRLKYAILRGLICFASVRGLQPFRNLPNLK